MARIQHGKIVVHLERSMWDTWEGVPFRRIFTINRGGIRPGRAAERGEVFHRFKHIFGGWRQSNRHSHEY